MKKDYQAPTYEIIEWDDEDIITESPSHSDGPDVDVGEWEW